MMTRIVAAMIFAALTAIASVSHADTRGGHGGDGPSPSGFLAFGLGSPTQQPDVAGDANTDGQVDQIIVVRTGL